MTMVGIEKGALQSQTLRLYGELLARGRGLGGCLVLAAGAGCSASGLPAAVSIGGGAMLAVDPDAATVKAVLRSGGLDFVVNTLDEALRVLKNEIRKQRPLSVGLTAKLEDVLEELTERGVLPEFEVGMGDLATATDEPLSELAAQGMRRIHLAAEGGVVVPSATLATWLAERGWVEIRFSVGSLGELKTLDRWLLEVLPQTENLRRVWLQRIGHYQRPTAEAGRVLWLNKAERTAMAAAVPGLVIDQF